MGAKMWRLPASKVVRSGKFSVIQDNGVMRGTAPASNGFYLFSEAGAGVKPLVLVGTADEILEFLMLRKHSGIENRIPDLPEIYMQVAPARASARFKGLFPMHDFIKQIVETVASFVPGSKLTDVAGGAKDLVDNVKFSRSSPYDKAHTKSKVSTLPANTYAVFWHYLQDDGFVKIASGKVGFDALYAYVDRELTKSLVG